MPEMQGIVNILKGILKTTGLTSAFFQAHKTFVFSFAKLLL